MCQNHLPISNVLCIICDERNYRPFALICPLCDFSTKPDIGSQSLIKVIVHVIMEVINIFHSLAVWKTTTGGNHNLLACVVTTWKNSTHYTMGGNAEKLKHDFQLTRMA